jgi:adenine-specific DNA-methyltransferase
LKLICDEIFGNRNFVAGIPWKGKGGGADNKFLMVAHEYILFYTKAKKEFIIGEEEKENESFPKYDKEKDNFYKTQLLRKWGSNSRREDRPNLYYAITNNDGIEIFPKLPNGDDGCWRWSKDTMKNASENGLIEFLEKDNEIIAYEKIYKPIIGNNTKKYSTWFDSVATNAEGSKELKNTFGNKVFDFPKPTNLIETLLKISNADKNSIILDSFAGSGTTAHAVLNLNKEDGGNRKFILIEMEDYANDITAERVKRVAKGYGEGKKAIAGTGGEFDYYELGMALFDEHENLNEKVGIKKIREYIWYSETRTNFIEPKKENKEEEITYFLGKKNDTVYYFVYEKESLTTLDFETLSIVETKGEQYIIYADNCLLPLEFMRKNNIVFKKIPRDITKF